MNNKIGTIFQIVFLIVFLYFIFTFYEVFDEYISLPRNTTKNLIKSIEFFIKALSSICIIVVCIFSMTWLQLQKRA